MGRGFWTDGGDGGCCLNLLGEGGRFFGLDLLVEGDVDLFVTGFDGDGGLLAPVLGGDGGLLAPVAGDEGLLAPVAGDEGLGLPVLVGHKGLFAKFGEGERLRLVEAGDEGRFSLICFCMASADVVSLAVAPSTEF